MRIKKLQIIFYSILLNIFLLANAHAEDECFEKVSRGVFKFNQGFDNIILEPVAKMYNKLPEPVRNGTGNFTSNIATLLSIPNHLLQGNLRNQCEEDPRTTWRSYLVRIDSEGKIIWEKTGSFTFPGEENEEDVPSTASEWVFIKRNGEIASVVDLAFGIGLELIN